MSWAQAPRESRLRVRLMFGPGRELTSGTFEAVSFPSYKGKLMLKRISAGLLLFSLAWSSQAQLHSATGPRHKPLPTAPKAAYNSMSKSTTPFNCQELAWPNHPHPSMKAYCERVEARTLSAEAQRAGRPGPSDNVIKLPALGSDASKRSGTACIAGQAFRKLPSGWEQIHADAGGWQRCREQ